jgi:hypothetical protein
LNEPFEGSGAKRAVCTEKIAKWSEAELSNFNDKVLIQKKPLQQGVWEQSNQSPCCNGRRE